MAHVRIAVVNDFVAALTTISPYPTIPQTSDPGDPSGSGSSTFTVSPSITPVQTSDPGDPTISNSDLPAREVITGSVSAAVGLGILSVVMAVALLFAVHRCRKRLNRTNAAVEKPMPIYAGELNHYA